MSSCATTCRTKIIQYNNSRSVVQEEMSLKRFLIWKSGGPPVPWSETNYAILKKGIIGNIHVKFFEIWTDGSGGGVV